MKHCEQVLELLRKQIGNKEEVRDIERTAVDVAERWIDPLSGGTAQLNGLIYGLVQSGKTGVIAVTGAIAADRGYKAIIILTSDINPLYLQTLNRVREAFPGMDILGKDDFHDADAFVNRVRGGTCAIVTTKNAGRLDCLMENFRRGNLKGASCLLIDDEADQASLNTRARRDDGSRSAINERIGELRLFFDKNTYLHVTATPQALFLQTPGHDFRPKFTVLSHPGSAYVGGDDFFGDSSTLVRNFDLNDIAALSAGAQPIPGLMMPASLLSALDTFMIAATYKRSLDVSQNCAFLCHVSIRKNDHVHIVKLLRDYKASLKTDLDSNSKTVLVRLRVAYDDLARTDPGISNASFDDLVDKIRFFTPGIHVKLVNGETDEDVAVSSPYNLFVGGNKLGRGVTIKNLLVSYYGRHPRQPQADTVLQHARMYGYRRADLGLLRLYLPDQLHTVFRAINQMERGLRDLIAQHPSEDFRGIYLENNLNPTRKNIIAPGAVGVYSAGSSYNPAQVLRDDSVASTTEAIDEKLRSIFDKTYEERPIAELAEILRSIKADPASAEGVWDQDALAESLAQFAHLRNERNGYLYVDRDRGLIENRRETQGILDGGEAGRVADDKITIFLLRTKAERGRNSAWWPQVRFPHGRYAFAFAL